ncbi:YhcN/YlaJ family sporulation lipoprotein [Jeotgalibacillus proteolyticus]|uniref:Sporulation protein n=1 Tax=Jeotgalibacillus proteolyticus TaxID=2082395 RepID=A0A2S5GET2_9BACL|nr:YhcN/YlaJ family sporulation lipoprotein [Jeotgalibacillus proteolyticus]PPA71530.1 hypothetical protein C4B60_05570 [Jeotgalibacillus proteolyticus]
MKKTLLLVLLAAITAGCNHSYKGADPHQEPPILSRENDRYDQQNGKDIASLDGLMDSGSNMRDEMHQGEFADHLAELIAAINDVDNVKVIIHENVIAAAVTHSAGKDLMEEVFNTVNNEAGGQYEIYVSQDKAAYWVAQGIDTGMRDGLDEEWEHDNMASLIPLMTKMS